MVTWTVETAEMNWDVQESPAGWISSGVRQDNVVSTPILNVTIKMTVGIIVMSKIAVSKKFILFLSQMGYVLALNVM